MSNGKVKEATIAAGPISLAKAVTATKVRWFLLFFIWMSCLIAYMDRVNLSVCGPMIMKDFGWDKVQLGMTMSAFFLSYFLMQIPGGLLSEKFGIRKTGAGAIIWWSIFTALTPLAWGFYSFMIIRFLFGAGEGPLFPNNGSFIAKWFNTKEKAMASGIMISGAFIGPAVGPPLTVWIMTTWGWQAVFYAYGALGFIIACLWYIFSRDYPHLHPKANDAEVELIAEQSVAQAKASAIHEVAPWKKFLVSPQFWTLGLQYYTVNYIMYIFLSWLPIYLLEARGLSLKAMGFAAAYPWLAICAALIIGGRISDKMQAKGKSKFQSRTIPALIGMVICGLSFYQGANATTVNENLFWMTLSLGFLGLTYTASYTACQDLGQRFGGSMVGWMNTWANIGGFTAPTITAILVQAYGWQAAFSMTSIVVAFGAVCWLFVKPDKPLVSPPPVAQNQ
jgi:ACS family glucarate transporter-like MFS transporter